MQENVNNLYDLTRTNAPQLIAQAFENWSIEEHDTQHRFNVNDGWSILRDDFYELVEDPQTVGIYIKKYLGQCYRVENGVKEPIYVTKNLVSDIIGTLQSLDEVYLKQSAPACLDGSNIDMSRVLAFKNTLLDISKDPCEMLDPSADLYVLNRKDYNYDTNAKCPLWKRFLLEIFEAENIDDIAIKIIQEMFGLLLTSETGYHKIFAMIGPKRSGKGTIIKVLQALLGHNEVTTTNLTQLPTQFGTQNLIGRSVCVVPDASFDSKRTDIKRGVEILKSVSGEDPIEIHRKYKIAKEFTKLPIRFVIVSNTIQELSDPSGAMASRLLFLVTQRSFYGKEDKNLFSKLSKELPGILNWALRGLRRLEKRGRFLESPHGLEAKKAAEELGSSMIAFTNHCCIKGPEHTVEKQLLFDRFNEWLIQNRVQRLGRTQFYQEFMSAIPTCSEAQIYVKDSGIPDGKRRIRVYKGVKLRKDWKQ
ncbi:MAG: DNA primase family protein [Sedimentisphaerales bacterium]